jgi:hypothetical protein
MSKTFTSDTYTYTGPYEELGSGASGKILAFDVVKNDNPGESKRMAVKQFNQFMNDNYNIEKANLDKMKSIPYLKSIYESWFTDDKFNILCMDMYKTNFDTYGFNNVDSETFMDKFLLKLIIFIMVLYENNLYYTDLKPANILNNDTEMILGDIGSIVFIDNDIDRKTPAITPPYKLAHSFIHEAHDRNMIRSQTLYALCLNLIIIMCHYFKLNNLLINPQKEWCTILHALNSAWYSARTNFSSNVPKNLKPLFKKYKKKMENNNDYYQLNIDVLIDIMENIKPAEREMFSPIFDIIRLIFEHLRDNRDLAQIFNQIRINMLNLCITREADKMKIGSRSHRLIESRKKCSKDMDQIIEQSHLNVAIHLPSNASQ